MLKPSAPGLVAGTIALVMDGVYLSLILDEGHNDMGQVVPFALLIGGAGVALVGGSLLADPKLRASLLWPPALVLTGLGVLAIFTIACSCSPVSWPRWLRRGRPPPCAAPDPSVG